MSETLKKSSMALTVAILAIAFCQMGHMITIPLIATIIMSSPAYDPTFIALIQTFPSLGIIIGSFFYGTLERKMGYKKLLILGTVLFAIGGVTPAFLGDNIPTIMVFRVILGLGEAVFMSMTGSMIAKMFSMEQGAKVNGWVQFSSGLGGVFFQTLSGMLGQYDWHYANYLAAVCIITLIIALIALPKDATVQTADSEVAQEAIQSGKSLSLLEKYPPIIFLFVIEIIVFMAGIGCLMMNISSVVASVGGTSADAGLASSAHTFVGFFAAIAMGVVFKYTKEYILAISSAVAAVSCLLIYNADSLPVIYFAAGFYGVAAPWVIATLMQLAGKYAAPIAAAGAVALMVAAAQAGNLLEGFMMPALCDMLGLNAAAGIDPFLVHTVLNAVLAVVLAVQAATGQKKRMEKAEQQAQALSSSN